MIILKNAKDAAILRKKLIKKQNGKCAICQKIMDKPVLDHEHTKRIGGTGKIRGVICNGCNILLGKIENNCKRYGVKLHELSFWLNNASDYITKQLDIIHYSEIKKQKKLKRTSYNKVREYFGGHGINGSGKFPGYPKTGKMTVRLTKAFEKAGIEPEYYK